MWCTASRFALAVAKESRCLESLTVIVVVVDVANAVRPTVTLTLAEVEAESLAPLPENTATRSFAPGFKAEPTTPSVAVEVGALAHHQRCCAQ